MNKYVTSEQAKGFICQHCSTPSACSCCTVTNEIESSAKTLDEFFQDEVEEQREREEAAGPAEIRNASEQLIPCPFCGGKAHALGHYFYMGPMVYGVACNKCKTVLAYFNTLGEAVATWNKRMEDENE